MIELEPGTYSRVSVGWFLPNFTRLEGAGMDETLVTCDCGTISINGSVTIADVTIESDGAVTAFAIRAADDTLRLESTRVRMTGSGSGTVLLDFGGSATVVDSIVERHNPTSSNGDAFRVDGGGTLDLRRSEVMVSGTSVEAIFAESASVFIADSFVTSASSTALFTCCQETSESVTWTIERSTVAGATPIAVSGLSTLAITDSTLVKTGSPTGTAVAGSTSGVTTIRSSTIPVGSVTGGATCVGIATATAWLDATCP